MNIYFYETVPLPCDSSIFLVPRTLELFCDRLSPSLWVWRPPSKPNILDSSGVLSDK